MDDLLTNPWIIGIGVTIVGGIILHKLTGKDRNSNKISSNASNSPHIIASGNMSAGRDIVVGGNTNKDIQSQSKFGLNPGEIYEKLKKLPPGQRKKIAESYEGLKISWSVKFITIVENKNIFVITHYLYDVYRYITVTFLVSKKAYPELNLIEENHEFKVEGEIESVDPIDGSIRLKNCNCKFN